MPKPKNPESGLNHTSLAIPKAWGEWLQQVATHYGIKVSNSKIVITMLQLTATTSPEILRDTFAQIRDKQEQ